MILLTGEVNNKVVPRLRSIEAGASTFFTCKADNKVMWYFNGGDLPKNVITGVEDGRPYYWLRILNAKIENTGNYECYGVDELEDYFEDHGVLVVIGKFCY